MLKENGVRLSNLLLSLSDAMDMAAPNIASHQMRTAFIAWKLAAAAGLDENEAGRIFLAGLLHDIGALSVEEKIGLHAGTWEKDLDDHCILGEAMFMMSPILSPAASIVRHHHRPWKEWDAPISAPDTLGAQILFLADRTERSIRRKEFILHQTMGIDALVADLEKTGKVHPDVAGLFTQVSLYEDFWLDLASPRLYSLLLHSGPHRKNEIGRGDLREIAAIFCRIIDFKSRFTATHSTGVSTAAMLIAERFGFTEHEVARIGMAGQFHDLGKLAVPNRILDKPGKLNKTEFDVIRQHTYLTYTVLSTIGGLGEIAEWAAFHHEKLDGSGYPFHVKADRIDTGARIMAVADVFTALNEDRPYRERLDRDTVTRIMTSMADSGALDRRMVGILADDFDMISERTRARQAESATEFRARFREIYG